MSLKITLKPHERMILGGAVIRNGNKATDFFVENNVSLLREKNILNEAGANSPCKRIYFTIQLMYIDQGNIALYQKAYDELVNEVVIAAPSTRTFVDQINEAISADKLYSALKLAHNLIKYEEKLLGFTPCPS